MNKIADIASAVIVLAVIFVLVRPGSQGPSFVSAIGSSFGGVIKSATGGGGWSSK